MKTNYLRTVVSGAIVWSMIFALFVVLSYIPAVKDNQLIQGIVVAILLIPISLIGATYYYKNNTAGNGIIVGVFMSLTALLLDAFITVPLFILPTENGSYSQFYSDPLLWILIAVNITVVAFYKLLNKVENKNLVVE